LIRYFHYKLFVYGIFAMMLSGCASNNITSDTTSTSTVKQKDELPQSPAEDLIDLAKQNWLQYQDIERRNTLLVNAAQSFQNKQQCTKTDIVLASINGTISDQRNQQLNQLLKAECALFSLSRRPMPLDIIEGWSNAINMPILMDRNQVLQAYLSALDNDFESAIEHLLPVIDQASILNQHPALTIWRWFTQLSSIKRAELNARYPELSAYGDLANLIDNVELSDLGRQQAIVNWQEQHKQHALIADFPENIQSFLRQEFRVIDKISILLPLSGRLEAQGDAIKQGITAAYLKQFETISSQNPSNAVPELNFIDTGSNLTVLSEEATESAIYNESDLLIGPLLKAHVEQVEQLNLRNIPTIYLNRADQQRPHASSNLYFSLSPEDEGSQIARVMIDKAMTTPVIISNDSPTSQRMLSAFLDTWQHYGALSSTQHQAPAVIKFTNNKSMRIGITSALDVLQSQRRISDMSNLSTETVHSVTRNRRDVDAFVVFAKPDEIELINPIIEASISLFSDAALPVYASSYSYQHQLNKNSVRDLRNMVFIDMPWLMPDQRQSDLAIEVDKIWNSPPSSFLRLFAFGFDSYQFAQNYQQLSFFKQNRLTGLTGTLQVNDSQQVVRELPLAKISEDEITLVDGL